jgi:hypothetical protein
MTASELEEKVWELVDEHSMSMSKQEYLELLQGVRDTANIRAEAVELDIEDDDEEEYIDDDEEN